MPVPTAGTGTRQLLCLSPLGDWHLQDFMASARACACPRRDRHQKFPLLRNSSALE
ncbi:hypothetical protein L493_2311 [Bordetella bronchiseptica 99-R-0433]|nr:hypothetical protein L493_2311 [Bordetella bronchiseptica 99-R-0433]